MSDANFTALTARLTGPLDISTVSADISALLAHTTRLRASIWVILEADPGVDRLASLRHLRQLVRGSEHGK